MTIDLTKQKGCYTKELADSRSDIAKMFYDKSVSFDCLQDTVHKVVRRASNTKARSRFIGYLYNDCYTKRDIMNLCDNAIAKGRNYQC